MWQGRGLRRAFGWICVRAFGAQAGSGGRWSSRRALSLRSSEYAPTGLASTAGLAPSRRCTGLGWRPQARHASPCHAPFEVS